MIDSSHIIKNANRTGVWMPSALIANYNQKGIKGKLGIMTGGLCMIGRFPVITNSHRTTNYDRSPRLTNSKYHCRFQRMSTLVWSIEPDIHCFTGLPIPMGPPLLSSVMMMIMMSSFTLYMHVNHNLICIMVRLTYIKREEITRRSLRLGNESGQNTGERCNVTH